ncbi:MAG: DUF2461 domain-containing protein [Chloroflexi bacterium]|nr:MAG: DUF2461 domain-containing protein [Chloroflexota bacterium]
MAGGKFLGWRGDFKGFFLGLRANNNKAWFDAHRRQYEDDVKAPMLALLADLEAEFGPPHMVDDAQLKRFREAVAAEQSGGALTGIVAGLRKKGYDVEGQELKRVPPPYPQDHPRAELLRHKRLIYWKRWPAEPWIATPKARDRVAQVWRDGADLEAWMRKHMDR